MSSRRSRLAAFVLAVIAVGLAVRLLPLGLPTMVVKYAGSILWGAMVYGIVAVLRPATSPLRLAGIALAAAVLVELFRLVHTPWLDAFRLTLAGQLLLGRLFSPWNILAYAAGIAATAGLEARTRRVLALIGPTYVFPLAGAFTRFAGWPAARRKVARGNRERSWQAGTAERSSSPGRARAWDAPSRSSSRAGAGTWR